MAAGSSTYTTKPTTLMCVLRGTVLGEQPEDDLVPGGGDDDVLGLTINVGMSVMSRSL